MKYKGIEIGEKPTLAMIEEFIEEMGYDLNAAEVYKKYDNRNWMTKKKTPLKSVEALLSSANGIEMERKRKKGIEVKKRVPKSEKARQKQKERSDYYELLKDPRWQKRRLEIMQRDNFTCQMCGNGLTSGVPLNVHHYVYHKGYLPWEYPDKELITLCRDCHHKLHEHKPNTTRK